MDTIPFSWSVDEFVATLTIYGHANSVLETITALPRNLDLRVKPSNWIDTLAEFIAEIAPTKGSEVCWYGVEEGLLRFQRGDKALLKFPEDSAAGLACKAELHSPTTA